MTPLILFESGHALRVKNRCLIVENSKREPILSFPSGEFPYDMVVIDHWVGYISFEAVHYLSAHGIPIAFISLQGKLQSVFLPVQHNSLFSKVRLLQYQTFLDSEKKSEISNAFLQARIIGMNSFLSELGEPSLKPFNSEGSLTSLYFRSIRAYLIKSNCPYRFSARKSKSRNWHAMSEINCLFNYGYAILEALVRKNIFYAGLEPDLGFRHVSYESKEALVYDFQDVFRHHVEKAVLNCLSQRVFEKRDFILLPDYTYRLYPSAGKVLIEEIAKSFDDKQVFYSVRDFVRYLKGDLPLDLTAKRALKIDSLRVKSV